MDSKGIEFQSFNVLATIQAKDAQKEGPAIKPVEKGTKGSLWPDVKRGNSTEKADTSILSNKEDAQTASDIMSEYLSSFPELESDWKYDRDHNVLVVVIKNRETGEILRQIPPEEILSGAFIPDTDSSGNIINKTA